MKKDELANNGSSLSKTLADSIDQMQLIKTLDRVYRDKLRDEGALRLGSFAAYREIEDARQDEMEGKRLLTFDNEKEITLSAEQFSTILPSNTLIRGGGYVKISPTAIVNLGSSIPDAYILCVSETWQQQLANSFFEIKDPVLFQKHILEILRGIDSRAFSVVAEKVNYAEKIVTITRPEDIDGLSGHNSRPAERKEYFSKPASYILEREFRFVFLTETTLANRFTDIVCDPLIIAKCCSFPD